MQASRSETTVLEYSSSSQRRSLSACQPRLLLLRPSLSVDAGALPPKTGASSPLIQLPRRLLVLMPCSLQQVSVQRILPLLPLQASQQEEQ